jgi:hypothetical protein
LRKAGSAGNTTLSDYLPVFQDPVRKPVMDVRRSPKRGQRTVLPLPSHDRHFFACDPAFGRFGIRLIKPELT